MYSIMPLQIVIISFLLLQCGWLWFLLPTWLLQEGLLNYCLEAMKVDILALCLISDGKLSDLHCLAMLLVMGLLYMNNTILRYIPSYAYFVGSFPNWMDVESYQKLSLHLLNCHITLSFLLHSAVLRPCAQRSLQAGFGVHMWCWR